MTTTAPLVPNPFIGPRSFETGEKLYGREREVRDLLHLLIAERVVLLYSPSGAGKSSLVKAALIPALTQKDFVPLPPIRVNQELPPGAPPDANRYVYSTLLSLEERFPPAERLPVRELAALCLTDYLRQRALPPIRAMDRDPVLLFDQFEEVLTAGPTDIAAKHAFFAQLGQALGDRHLWALFAMREDYVTALDPYLTPIPNRFKDTFRLDLLGVNAAHQAMQGPAKAAGVLFSTTAAMRLADDLRRTRVQQPDGRRVEVLGPYVEPVQLQVVCLRLWEQRFAPDSSGRKPVITPDDITDVGDVDSALAGYYANRVRAVAAATGVRERTIRDWFDDELITPQGLRSQVMREAQRSAGLDNRAIIGLIDAHLVRGDERQGTVWFELAHDRLVAPIQQNNAAWRLQTLTAFQRQAILWEEQGRGDGLLLQGEELVEAEQWAEAHVAELTEEERAFLETCRKARAIREQQEKANQRMRQAFVGAVAAAVVAIVLAGLAYFKSQEADYQRQLALQQQKTADIARLEAERQSRRAELQARIAQLRAFAAQSLDAQDRVPRQSLLLAAATQDMPISDSLRLSIGLNTLIQGLQRIGGTPLLGHTDRIATLAFSPDGRFLATGGADTTARLWRADAPATPPVVLTGHAGAVAVLAFSPDGRFLATGGADKTVRLWSVDAPATPPVVLTGHAGAVAVLAFSPDGRFLATGGADKTVRLWSVDAPATPPIVLSGHEADISRLVFSPDGRFLATSSGDKTIRLWRLDALSAPPSVLASQSTTWGLAFSSDGRFLAAGGDAKIVRLWYVDAPASPPIVLAGHQSSITALAFSPDGQFLASGSWDTTVQLWRLDALSTPPIVLTGHERAITILVFSPDGRFLASGSGDETARLWRVDVPTTTPVVLAGHEHTVAVLAFSPNGRFLATGSWDTTARLWRLEAPMPSPMLLSGHEDNIITLAFSPDGRFLASGGVDTTARLWRLDTPSAPPIALVGHKGTIWTLAFSPDGRFLATGSADATVRLWRVDAPATLPLVLTGPRTDISALTFSADGRFLAAGSTDKIVRLWRLDTPSTPPIVLAGHEAAIRAVVFSADGRFLATAGDDTTARLWRLDAPSAPPIVLSGHGAAIRTVVFSPDGRLLATAGDDTTARLWRLDAPSTPPTVLSGHTDVIWTLAFSPDGHFLATGSSDMTARLWRLDAPSTPPIVLSGHTDVIWTLAFSPDGHFLATGSSDTTARLWRLDAPSTPPIVLSGHEDIIRMVAFGPDGRMLATGSFDNTARLWHVDSQELVQLACAVAGRNFSLNEWQQLYDAATPYAKTCLWLPYHPSVYHDLLVHGQFDLALMGYQEDRSFDRAAEEPTAWLIARAANVSNDAPLQSLLTYLLARWRDPQLRNANRADLAALCQTGADKLLTPALLDTCDRAVAANPGSLGAVYARGRLRAHLGDDAGALADLQTARRLAQEQQDEATLKDIQRWIGDLLPLTPMRR